MKKREQKGAVSIFLVIILMACLMFGGFFIDSARILVAKRHVKNALNSAARSTLSYYDEGLVSEYGLFAFDGEVATGQFNRYLTNNLVKSSDEGMQFFQYKINSSKVTPQRPLSGAELERQIVEYEKYRGPVNITIGVVEKIKQMFGANKIDVNEVSTAQESIDSIKSNFKDKDGILSQAKKALKVTIKENIKSGIQKDVKTITSNWVNETLFNSLNGENGYYKQAEKEIASAKEQLEYLKKQRDNYVNAAKDLCNGSSQEATSGEAKQYVNQDQTLQQQADAQIAQLEKDIQEAESVLAGVKTDIEAKRVELSGIVAELEKERANLAEVERQLNGDQKTQGAYSVRSDASTRKTSAEKTYFTYRDAIKNGTTTVTTQQGKIKEYETKIQELEEKLLEQHNVDINDSDYEDDLWAEYKRIMKKTDRTAEEKKWLREVEKKYQSAWATPEEALVNQMMKNYKSILESQSKIAKAQSNQAEAQKKIGDAEKEYNDACTAYTVADNRVKELEEQKRQIQAAMKELEDAVKTKQNEMKADADRLGNIPDFNVKGVTVPNLSKTVSTLADTVTGYVDLFANIKEAFKQLTRSMKTVTTSTGACVVDTEEKNILTMLTSLTTNIKKIAEICTNFESLRNEMYFIDYVMDKNTFLTSQTKRSHYFQMAEVEYIIYGFDKQGANVLAALGSIYGIRFVIDSIDYFFDVTNSPELISRIAIAIGKGAVRAGLDMVDMLVDTTGDGAKGCALTPSITNVRLSYSDHLRIFLLLNAGTSKDALKNAMSTTLVKEKKSKDMDELYTQIYAEVEAEVNLLILPMIGSDLLPNNYFRNGSYVIRESIVEGYE